MITHSEKENLENLKKLRHSAAHIMAQAVKSVYPEALLGIGPDIENGFYYDFELKQTLSDNDLINIEKKMQEIINQQQPFICHQKEYEEAKLILKNEPYKLELLAELPKDSISFYQNNDFWDLCKGPHLTNTSQLKHFKLLKTAGAYWRGDENKTMLQRIYGTAFFTQEDLENYLVFLEEANKRDHRKLGKELELFMINESAGAGLVYYLPKGALLKKSIEDFTWQENVKRGYQHVNIPHIAKIDLWQTSGHADHYKDNMYFLEVDEQPYALKPMNCPGHILIYNSKLRSYRNLPIRLAEFGTVYRYERSGVLHGLLRVRGFTQDDAHIFCTNQQLESEIISVLQYADFMMKTFGFKYDIYLSTRPQKFVGTEANWQEATLALSNALEKLKLKYTIDEGEGVFYGPKIDIKFKDVLGRSWQGPTVQVDFNLPERFNLNYIGVDGAKHRPVMIHRVVLGSFERFIGALIEHYAGNFPLWLSPVQIKIISISEDQEAYCLNLAEKFQEQNLRIELDLRPEKIGAKIREAEKEKVPYMLIIGKKEIEQNKIAVRKRKDGDLGLFSFTDFLTKIKEEIIKKE